MSGVNQLLGSAIVKVDGQTFRQEKGATLDPGGKKRTTKTGSGKVLGFTVETVQSKLELTIAMGPETSLAEISSWENVVATFECDTGQTYVINGGWVTDPPPVDESAGTVKIMIEGPPAEELL